MKGLAKTPTLFFSYLFDLADQNEGYIKLDNDNAFMPLSIERIGGNQNYQFYSVAHYYKQNGDLMADPEITFCRRKQKVNHDVFIGSLSWKMDGLGIYRDEFLVFNEEGNIIAWRESNFKDTNRFCKDWAINIKRQQKLKIKKGSLILP